MKLRKMVVAAVSAVALTVGGAGIAQAVPKSAEAFCGPAGDQCSLLLQGGSPITHKTMGEDVNVIFQGVTGESVELQMFRVLLGRSETGKETDSPVLAFEKVGATKTVTAAGTFDADQVKFPTSPEWMGGNYVVAPSDWDGKALSGLIPSGKGSTSVSVGFLDSARPLIQGLPGADYGTYTDCDDGGELVGGLTLAYDWRPRRPVFAVDLSPAFQLSIGAGRAGSDLIGA